jgi:ParB family transcriptional regulator, chromosome partitioning protein
MKDKPVPKGANNFKRQALGRGLSVLMSSSAVNVKPAEENTAPSFPLPEKEPESEQEHGIVYLSIDRVFPSEGQPRKHFDNEELRALSKSIKETGLLQPIVVRRRKGEVGPLAKYDIVAGERRFRAAKMAGLKQLPAVTRQLSDAQALEIGIIENVQRSDLNPIEEAQAYSRLIDEFGGTQESVAQVVGKDRVTIANALRLLKLESSVQQLIVEKKLNAGHGRALLMTTDLTAQREFARAIVSQGLSVRAAERLVQEQLTGGTSAEQPKNEVSGASRSTRAKPIAAVELEERLRRALGTKVQLALSGPGRGEVRISFFSEAELESLLEKIGA